MMPVDLNLPNPGQSPNWGPQLNNEIEKINQAFDNASYQDSPSTQNINNTGSQTRTALDRLYPYKGSDLQGMSNVPQLTSLGVVASAASLGQPTAGYPCVVDNRDGFIPGRGNYLAFFSTDHTGGSSPGILMSSFSTHGGAWSAPVSVVNRGNQLETPWVVFDKARGRVLLYASGMSQDPNQTASQVTVVWESTPSRLGADLTDWTYRTVSHDWENPHQGLLTNSNEPAMHAGYQRPAIVGGGFVSRGLSTGGSLSTQETWYSTSGIRWFRGGRPSANQVEVNDVGANFRVLLDQFVTWNGEVWGVGRFRVWGTFGSSGGSGTQLVMGRMKDDLSGFSGRPYSVFSPGPDVDIRGYCLMIEDSQPILYYSSTPNGIELARIV